MQTSTATLTALHSPYALSVFTDRLARYRRMPVDAHGFIVSIPDAGRVLVRQEGRSLTVNVVAPDERTLAASMAAVVSELEQGFGTLANGWGYVQFCLFGGDGVYGASQLFLPVTTGHSFFGFGF
jgi:hypothetical protein